MSGLVIADLAHAILMALGPPLDQHGNPVSVTAEMTAYAHSVIDTYKAGKVNNATGTVNATGAPGAPVTLGAATGGLVSGLSPSTYKAPLTAAFAGANPATLTTEANGSTTYLMASSLVSFAAGDITGNCTATPVSPGVLAGGAGTGGKIAGPAGAAWAAALGNTFPLGSPVYSAIAAYVIANAQCSYATNAVTGAFAAGGGAMTAGTGLNGTIA